MAHKTQLEELLAELHTLTVKELITIIRDGVPVIDKETGEVTDKVPAPAAYIAAAIKLLKDNNITADRVPGTPLDDLAASLPDFADEDDEYDHKRMQ